MNKVKLVIAILILLPGFYVMPDPLVIDGVRCGNYTGVTVHSGGAMSIKTKGCQLAKPPIDTQCRREYQELGVCLREIWGKNKKEEK